MTFQFKYPTPLSTTYNGVVYRRGTIPWFLMEFGKLEKSFLLFFSSSCKVSVPKSLSQWYFFQPIGLRFLTPPMQPGQACPSTPATATGPQQDWQIRPNDLILEYVFS